MKASGMSRPGAMQLAVATSASVLFGVGEIFWIVNRPGSADSSLIVDNDFLLPLAIFVILAWHYTAGFHKYAADKGLDAKTITSYWRTGFLGLIFMLKARDRSDDISASEPERNVLSTHTGLSSSQHIKLTIIVVIVFLVTAVALPWALWASNYAQANDDFAENQWNELRIGFAEDALKRFPNAQDLSKVFYLKSKIYKSQAAQMRGNLPLLDAKEAAERKKNIDACEKVSQEAAAEAKRLSSENWGVSSNAVFTALGAFYLMSLLLASFIFKSKRQETITDPNQGI